jgi:hypothetical protein
VYGKVVYGSIWEQIEEQGGGGFNGLRLPLAGHVGGLISSDNMTETYLLQLLVVLLHECRINLNLWCSTNLSKGLLAVKRGHQCGLNDR